MTYSQFAKRLGIARPSVYALESDEVSGVASLDRLNRAAAALDCKMVYALVPNDSLEETVKRQAFSKAKKRLGRVNVSQTLEESGLSEDAFFEQVHDLAIELMVERPNTLWDD